MKENNILNVISYFVVNMLPIIFLICSNLSTSILIVEIEIFLVANFNLTRVFIWNLKVGLYIIIFQTKSTSLL